MKKKPFDLFDFDLFSNVDPELTKKVKSRILATDYKAGEIIFLEGVAVESIALIASGKVEIAKSSYNGRKLILEILEKGQIINLIPLLVEADPQFRAHAVAITDVEIIKIPCVDFLMLMDNSLTFNTALIKILAQRIHKLIEFSADLGLKPVRSRLAKFLINQGDRFGKANWFTQDEIAAHIGSVRDVVGRNLRELEECGYLKRDRHQIILLDRSALERLANDLYF